jgi:ribosomal protein S14
MANFLRILKNAKRRKDVNLKHQRLADLRLLFNNRKKNKIVRITNICTLTGDGRSVYRHVGLSRHFFKRFANQGHILGIRRSSW